MTENWTPPAVQTSGVPCLLRGIAQDLTEDGQ